MHKELSEMKEIMEGEKGCLQNDIDKDGPNSSQGLQHLIRLNAVNLILTGLETMLILES